MQFKSELLPPHLPGGADSKHDISQCSCCPRPESNTSQKYFHCSNHARSAMQGFRQYPPHTSLCAVSQYANTASKQITYHPQFFTGVLISP